MKYKVSKTITEEIDIEFPAYHNDSNVIYTKTISEDRFIIVKLFSFDTDIAIRTGSNFLIDEDMKPITEAEFNQAYDKALRILLINRPLRRLAKLEKVFDVDEVPTNNRYNNIPAL